jgi:CSLREA domain-containing protein
MKGRRTALSLAVVLFGSLAASAATFVVNSTVDAVHGSCGNPCSLRDAVIAANANPGADIITLPSGSYQLSLTGVNEQAAATGDLDVAEDLTINGAGSGTTFIDGFAADRVFELIGNVTLTLNGVTVENGFTPLASTVKLGGGILATTGHVVLNNSVVTENQTTGTFNGGGGILAASVVMTNSTVSANVATGQGGGINAGSVTMTNSTVSGNSTPDQGGGIFTSTLSMTNSTVTQNTSTGDQGGGIWSGPVAITGSTITNNSGNDEGGGIFFGGNNSSISGTTITGNSAIAGGGFFMLGGLNTTITNCDISGNTARDVGGGAALLGGGVTMTGCTVSGNSVPDPFGSGGAGGINNSSTLALINCTVSGNTVAGPAGGTGGGIRNVSGSTLSVTDCTIANNSSPPPPPDFRFGLERTLQTNSGGNILNGGAATLTNTIVANAGSGENCGGTIVDGGTNLQFPGTTCGVTIPTADPLLQALANNGGPTQTRALGAGSPALNAGTTGCPPIPATDQRGVTRPQDTGCEIGAFECRTDQGECVAGVATNTPTNTPTSTPTSTPTFTPTQPGATATPTATRTQTPTQIAGVVVPTLTFPMLGLLGLVLAVAGTALLLLKRG